MKILTKTVVTIIGLSLFTTPAHAEISKSGSKKIIKVKAIKKIKSTNLSKAKFLTTSANLETTTTTPAPKIGRAHV